MSIKSKNSLPFPFIIDEGNVTVTRFTHDSVDARNALIQYVVATMCLTDLPPNRLSTVGPFRAFPSNRRNELLSSMIAWFVPDLYLVHVFESVFPLITSAG